MTEELKRALSRRAAKFTQAEVARAIRAADKADGKWAIEIERDGVIRLVPHIAHASLAKVEVVREIVF